MWLSGRVYALSHSNAQQMNVITWDSLNRQFSGTYGSLKGFTSCFKDCLQKVSQPWPGGLHYKVVKGEGIILRKSVLRVEPKSRMTIN